MMHEQGGVCAICKGSLDKPCVDHSHETGAIRGILCIPCNTGLGAFKDNTESLANAIEYLEQASYNF